LGAHARLADDDLEFVAQDGEMAPCGQIREQGAADGMEDGMIGDLEGDGEREAGGEEEGLAVAVGVEVGGLVWSAGGDEDVEGGRGVLEHVDGEVEGMGYPALWGGEQGATGDGRQTFERKKRTSWLESQGTRPETANWVAVASSRRLTPSL